MNKKPVQYAVHDSPLYRLSTKKKMWDVLRMSPAESEAIRRKKGYHFFKTSDRYRSDHLVLRHKARDIQSPEEALKRVQKRLADLLGRVVLPDYLHSARKGRSYKSNARAHKFGHSVARVDIKKFYERSHISFVQKYFLNVLKCSPDVTHRLAEIVTLKNRLPTGSPVSPIMSFLAYQPMFQELFELATSMGFTMTVYVDDVVVSGPGIASRFIEPAKAIIARYGLCAHKFSTSSAGQPVVVTGLRQTAAGESVPPARFQKIRALKEELEKSKDPEQQVALLKGLIGQYREGQGLIPNALSHANLFQRRLQAVPEAVRAKASLRRKRRPKRKPQGSGRSSHAVP